MSKYYKAEDVQELITACIWRMTLAKERNGEGFVEYDKQIIDVGELEKRLSYLPTIEVSEEQLSKLQASENSVENTTVSEDFTSISRANSKLEVSEDAPSVIPKPKEGECPYFIDGVWCNLVGKKMKGADDE